MGYGDRSTYPSCIANRASVVPSMTPAMVDNRWYNSSIVIADYDGDKGRTLGQISARKASANASIELAFPAGPIEIDDACIHPPSLSAALALPPPSEQSVPRSGPAATQNMFQSGTPYGGVRANAR